MIGGALFAVVGLLFLLAAIQLFTATLYQSLFGVVPNTALGVIALAVFGASLLAGASGARLGPRRGIAASAAMLAVPLILAIALRQEWLVLILTALAVVAGTHWLALLHAARPAEGAGSPLAAALPLALIIDLALRAATGTIPWYALPLPLALPLALVGALLLLAAGIAVTAGAAAWSAPDARQALGLVALPPLLLVGATGGLNGAQVALAGGLGLDGGPSTAIGTLVVGIGLAAGALLLARTAGARIAAAAALAGGTLLLWPHLAFLSTAAGAACAAGLLAGAAILPGGAAGSAGTPWRAGLALGLGWVLFVAGTFAHYAFFGQLEPLWLLTALVVAALLLAPSVPGPRWGVPRAALVGLLAVLVPAAALALVPSPQREDPPATFRVMTVNLHQGFDAGDVAALDRQADRILEEHVDVVAVQEVVRGWLIDEGHDLLGHLAARLGMDYVFGPNIGDLYGNAILSRYPISEVRRVHFAKEPGLRYQPRGALVARIAGVLVIATHLDENRDAGAVRMEQVRDLLRAWDGARIALIACDCNAPPEARELQLITDAGFADLALEAGGGGPTFPADAPVERIDYLFGIGLTPAQAHPVASTVSDHRALVLNVTRSGPSGD